MMLPPISTVNAQCSGCDSSTVSTQNLESAPLALSTASVQTFGDRLAHALKVRRRSQNWLESQAGFSRGHVSRLVSGRHHSPEPETIDRIAEALTVDYRWLATGKGEMTPRPDDAAQPQSKPIRFGDLPGWIEAERLARERFDDIPAYAFERAASTSGGRPPSRIDAHTVAAFARAWLESSTREERRAAELAEVAAAVAASDRAAKKTGGQLAASN